MNVKTASSLFDIYPRDTPACEHFEGGSSRLVEPVTEQATAASGPLDMLSPETLAKLNPSEAGVRQAQERKRVEAKTTAANVRDWHRELDR